MVVVLKGTFIQAAVLHDGFYFCTTVWHKIFARVYYCELAIFCVLRGVIFAIRTDWFFLLGTDFCNFQEAPSTQH